MKGGGRREKRSVGEHCWGRLASLLQAFGQRTKSIKKRSVDGEKVLRIIKNLMCSVKKVSAIGLSGKSQRCRISQQWSELCMQGARMDSF